MSCGEEKKKKKNAKIPYYKILLFSHDLKNIKISMVDDLTCG